MCAKLSCPPLPKPHPPPPRYVDFLRRIADTLAANRTTLLFGSGYMNRKTEKPSDRSLQALAKASIIGGVRGPLTVRECHGLGGGRGCHHIMPVTHQSPCTPLPPTMHSCGGLGRHITNPHHLYCSLILAPTPSTPPRVYAPPPPLLTGSAPPPPQSTCFPTPLTHWPCPLPPPQSTCAPTTYPPPTSGTWACWPDCSTVGGGTSCAR